MHPLISELTELVMANELDDAIQKLHHILSLSGSELLNDAIVISARHKKLRSDIRKGILDYQQQNVLHAQITNGMISLIEDLKEEETALEAYEDLNKSLEQASKSRKLSLSSQVKDALYDRLADAAQKQHFIRILWVDNHPENNTVDVELLQQSGQKVDCVTSSEAARAALAGGQYQLLISDMSREGNRTEGMDFLKELADADQLIPAIFYTGYKDPGRGIPPYTFGLTDSPEELLHLVMDVIARGHHLE